MKNELDINKVNNLTFEKGYLREVLSRRGTWENRFKNRRKDYTKKTYKYISLFKC